MKGDPPHPCTTTRLRPTAPDLNNRVRLAIGHASAQRMLDPIEHVFRKLLGGVEQLLHFPFEVR
jgi:hypothetical protein